MIWRCVAIDQALNGRQEIIGHRATDAAIGQFNHVVFGTSFDAATVNDAPIHAKIAKFVNDQRNPLAVGIFQHVADHGGFARTKKTGNHSCGNFTHLCHVRMSLNLKFNAEISLGYDLTCIGMPATTNVTRPAISAMR